MDSSSIFQVSDTYGIVAIARLNREKRDLFKGNVFIHLIGIKRGFLSMCERGLLSGNKIAGVQFTLLDDTHHIVECSEFGEFFTIQRSELVIFFAYQFTIEYTILFIISQSCCFAAFFQAA